MDLLAHGLWAAAGALVLRRRRLVDNKTVYGIVALAIAPDIIPVIPVIVWAATQSGSLAVVYAYVTAIPSTEPRLPDLMALLVHHLHCIMHSVVIQTFVAMIAWAVARAFPLVLLGWWSHILLDIPTHSTMYYKVPIFYPLSERGFDGIAWTEPWFLVANYLALAMVYGWLLSTRRRI